jgi:hypothetical protein
MWTNQTMTRLVLDSELRQKLRNLTEPLEHCDESGRVLAHLTTTIRLPHCETIEPQISGEELLRRKQNKSQTSTTAEVLAYPATL